MRNFALFVFLLITFANISQGLMPAGARSNALSNASICLTDAWAYHHNPGAIAFSEGINVAYSYESRFMLKELQTQSFVATLPIKNAVFSIGGQLYGSSLYRNNRVGLGYALKFIDKLSVGVQINYQNLRISNYINKGVLTGELGLLAKINSKVNVGFSVFNINQAKLSSFQDDRFSTYLRAGISYLISQKVLFLLEAEKELSTPLKPKMALEYQIHDKFFLRIGGSANPISLSFGTGYRFKMGFQFDLGTSYHQILGWTPHVGILYNSKQNK